MKSRACIATSLLLALFQIPVLACYPVSFEPREYFMFRISDNYLAKASYSTPFNYGANENCMLWQSETSGSIPLSDIYEVVYKADEELLESIVVHGIPLSRLPSQFRGNSFCKWLYSDKEAGEFLLLAKKCENARANVASPWYYPSKNDPDVATLEKIVSKADQHRSGRFSGRYLLQAERALLSLRRFDDCIDRWRDRESSVPDNVLRRLTARYVAGAYYNLGDIEKALDLYAEAQDVESILTCARTESIDVLHLLYKYAPESQALRTKVERHILDSECTLWNNWDDTFSDHERKDLEKILSLSLRIGEEGKVSDPDLWYYTAAFILHMLDNNTEALKTLSKAEASKGSQYIKDSARVLRMYLEALQNYSPTYEGRMLENVKWLEGKILENLSDEAKDYTRKFGMEYTSTNMSYFYWNDMLRKIVHSAIAPTLVKANKAPLAIAFSNMADYFIFNEVGDISTNWWDGETMTLERYRREASFNSLDYCTMTFSLMERVGVDSIVEYTRNLDKPSSSIFSYLNERSYTSRDYFNEIIGTRMIRDMRYNEAVDYLSMVSPTFQGQLNTYRDGYLSIDPFRIEKTPRGSRPETKLHFAIEMARLEKEIEERSEPNRKAPLMVRYATGIKNSFGHCWALSFYGLTCRDTDPENTESIFLSAQKKGYDRAAALYSKALSICTDDETRAQLNIFLGNARTIMTRYKGTKAEKYIRGHCDTYKDYHFEARERFRM